jgi:hypothetical protein
MICRTANLPRSTVGSPLAIQLCSKLQVMVCPQCRAEYRPGFTRCSDCDVELVETSPIPEEKDPLSSRNDRPDQAPPAYFLAWFLPFSLFALLVLAAAIRPSIFKNPVVSVTLFISMFVSSIGSYWMLYQSIRFERRVLRYAALSFIPFLSVWYLLVRYRLRRELPRLS